MDLPSLALTGFFSLSVFIIVLFRSLATLGLIPPHIHSLIRDFLWSFGTHSYVFCTHLSLGSVPLDARIRYSSNSTRRLLT